MAIVQNATGLRGITLVSLVSLSLMMVINSVLGLVSLRNSSEDYTRMINVIDFRARSAAKADSALQEAENFRKDFALHKQLHYSESFFESVRRFQGYIDGIARLDEQEETDVSEVLETIKASSVSYAQIFQKLLDLNLLIGLKDNEGLVGSLRRNAATIEEILGGTGRQDLMNMYLEIRRLEKNFSLREDAQYIDPLFRRLQRLRSEASLMNLPPDRRAIWNSALDAYTEDLRVFFESVMETWHLQRDLESTVDSIIPQLRIMVVDTESLKEKAVERSRKRRQFSSLLIRSVLLVSTVAAVALSSVILRRLSLPLKKILDVTDQMAQGRLDQRTNFSRQDEMGQIGTNIDHAAGQIAGLVTAIQEAVKEGAGLSDRLGSMAEETAASVSQVSQNISTIDVRTDEMKQSAQKARDSVSDIARKLQELGKASESQAGSVSKSSASVEEMAASVNNVNIIAIEKNQTARELEQLAEESRERVKETGQMSDEISQLTHSIQDAIALINAVAARTNLLAMNAAIEAAHAGEAGRGFSVVADEVRKLAESTGQNARTVNESLMAMISKVDQMRALSTLSVQALERMADDVRGFTGSFSEISSSMNEMAIGSREMLSNTGVLAVLTENLHHTLHELKTKAIQAGESVGDLSISVNTVSDGVEEIDRASDEINKATASLSVDGDRNRGVMAQLQRLSEGFIVAPDEAEVL